MTIKIYALINPTDNSYFYVGATKDSLEKRLKGHLQSSNKIEHQNGFIKERKNLIQTIQQSGNLPEIILLEEVDLNKADESEKKHYTILSEKGYTLIQDATKFKYFTTQTSRHTTPQTEFRSVLMRTRPSLFEKVRVFADKTDRTLAGAIRFILNQFFENRK